MFTEVIRANATYSTMQLARILEVNKSTINRWCNEGKLQFSVRALNGRRVYKGEKVLQMLKTI